MNRKKVLLLMLFIIMTSCSLEVALPEGCITVVVVDEEEKPMEGINVGIGFEKNTGSGTRGIPITGVTDANGKFIGRHKTINYASFRVFKDGYYDSGGEYRFQGAVGGKWTPWNPELKVMLKKIVNPVPMYARNTQHSKLTIPVSNKPVGFDLIDYDWVEPYGRGKYGDIKFNYSGKYITDSDYNNTLTITFNNNDGIQSVTNGVGISSSLKLPRYAPESGYKDKLMLFNKKTSGKPVETNFNDAHNYIFRVRSKVGDGKKLQYLYGKIHGEIRFYPISADEAVINFKYYLNPDYTRNLEFDQNKNLFKNLESFEQVGVE